MRLGAILRKWRTIEDKKLEEVAAEIGCSKSTLSRIERGQMPDGETVLMLVTWLFEGSEAETLAKQARAFEQEQRALRSVPATTDGSRPSAS